MPANTNLMAMIQGFSQHRLIFPVVFLLISSINAIASGNANAVSDTTGIYESNQVARTDSLNTKVTLALDAAVGVLTNSTFGTHFVLDVTGGILLKKKIFTNFMTLVYEHRFGNSRNKYKVFDNDSLKNAGGYNANFWGLEYRQMLFRNPYHDVYALVGAGYDWIVVKKGGDIMNNHTLGGLALNIGLGYGLRFAKKYGPEIEVIYHYANLANKNRTELAPSSLLIRLKVLLGPAPN